MNRTIAVIIAFIAIPACTADDFLPAEIKRLMSDAKQVNLACRMFAIDHDGRYPATLDELYPDYIDVEALLYGVEGTENLPRWIYNGAGLTDADRGDSVLLESAELYSGRRIIVRLDGSAAAQRSPYRK